MIESVSVDLRGPGPVRIPLGARSARVLAVKAELVTSAAVANRRVVVRAERETGEDHWAVDSKALQVASEGLEYTFGKMLGETYRREAMSSTFPIQTSELPDTFLPASSYVSVEVFNGDVGDVMTARMLIEFA